jgi:hypothetical protein
MPRSTLDPVAQRRVERGRGAVRPPAPPAPAGPRWLRGLGRGARLLFGALAALGLVSLVVGTVYVLRVEPWVKDRLVGESRLSVEVLSQTQFTPLGPAHGPIWLLPDDVAVEDVPADLLTPDRRAGYDQWARGAGGVAAYTASFRVVIRAVSDPPVLINGIRVDVVSRDEPAEGWFRVPEIGCGVQPVRRLAVDLDRSPVRPEFFDVDPATGEPLPVRPDLTLRVSPDDPEVLEVNAATRRHDVRFTIALLYQSESGPGEHVIGAGEPMRVTALGNGRARAYDAPPDEPPALVRDPTFDPDPAGALPIC